MGNEVVKQLHKTSRALVFNYQKLIENYGINLNITTQYNDEDRNKPEEFVPY